MPGQDIIQPILFEETQITYMIFYIVIRKRTVNFN